MTVLQVAFRAAHAARAYALCTQLSFRTHTVPGRPFKPRLCCDSLQCNTHHPLCARRHAFSWLHAAANKHICITTFRLHCVVCLQCDALKSEGAHVAQSPAAVIAKCDVTYAMLADPAAAKAVAMQEDGVVAGIKQSPGKAYVDVSTVDEGTSQEIAKAVQQAGGRFLEVPPHARLKAVGANKSGLAHVRWRCIQLDNGEPMASCSPSCRSAQMRVCLHVYPGAACSVHL